MSLLKHKKIPENEIPIAEDKSHKITWSIKKTGEDNFETDNEFKPIPYLNLKNKQRSAIFISAPSGAGKSTIARQILDSYREILGKKTRVILFTQTQDLDPVFENLTEGKYKEHFIHICIKTDPMYSLLTPELLKDSILIFDDYENLDKDLQGFTMTLIKDCLERGRKMNIQMMLINHQTMNYNRTRSLIFECDTYILFPSANRNSVRKFLLSYGDIDKKEVDDLIEGSMEPFDYLLLRKSAPRYILSKHRVKLLK